MDYWIELVIAALLVISGIFGIVGSLALIKLPDLMTRLHGPTKAATLGVGGVLIAAMLNAYFFEDRLSFHELMITLFLFLTAPVTAIFIAKAYLHRNVKEEDLPPTNAECGWSSYDDAPPEKRPVDTH